MRRRTIKRLSGTQLEIVKTELLAGKRQLGLPL